MIEHTESCVFCGAPGVRRIRLDEVFGPVGRQVLIENLPLLHCDSCGESYYEPETSRAIDEILAHPERYAVPAVARIA